jgi:hypothetical protein
MHSKGCIYSNEEKKKPPEILTRRCS